MTVKQISVFLENKPNKLAEFTTCLSGQGVDLRALTMTETSDFGIVRIIVDDTYNAVTILREADYICSITEVLAVKIEDEAGALAKMISLFGSENINVEYMYSVSTGKDGAAYMIIKVDDNVGVTDILDRNGIHTAGQEELMK